MDDNLEIKCPCCATKLVVDRSNGDVLSEERPKISERVSFEDAMRDVTSGAERREKAFGEAFDRTRRLEDTLAKKFEAARKKAAKDPSEKPTNPFDLD